MANNNSLPNHPGRLTSHLAGVLGGSLDAEAVPPSTTGGTDHLQPRHVISAGNSVTSSNSLPSSTKSAHAPSPASSAGGGASSLPPSHGGGDGGGVAPQAAPQSSASASAAPVPGTDPVSMPMAAPPHPVAEFLFQLTKMLTDNNAKYIEWRNASIFVHDPPGLEKDILPKYFRHSNYSSFQRQMNYFGFRKIAGKGKMAPCSYVNEAAKEDISSLLFIKRKKTGVSSAAAKLMAQQNRINRSLGVASLGLGGGIGLGAGNPLLGGTLPNAAVQANPALTINNIMVGAPGNNHLMSTAAVGGQGTLLSTGAGAGAGAGSGPSEANNNLISNPQNMLAQLQQAHAAALMSSQLPNASGGGTLPQAVQNKAPNDTYPGANNANAYTSTGNVLLTNDQGNVYANPGNPAADWSPQADAAAQSLLLQQCQQGISGGYPPGAGGGYPPSAAGAVPPDANGMVRLDSAANLRALLNQQISMFNPHAPAAMSAVMPPGPAAPQPAPAPISLPQATVAAPVGGFDWNEVLRGMGGGAAAALEQLGGVGTLPGQVASPAVPPYDLSGLFGTGGTASG